MGSHCSQMCLPPASLLFVLQQAATAFSWFVKSKQTASYERLFTLFSSTALTMATHIPGTSSHPRELPFTYCAYLRFVFTPRASLLCLGVEKLENNMKKICSVPWAMYGVLLSFIGVPSGRGVGAGGRLTISTAFSGFRKVSYSSFTSSGA